MRSTRCARNDPGCAKDGELYELDEAPAKRLYALPGVWEVHLYFGSRCPQCKKYMGRILRVLYDEVQQHKRAAAATGSKSLDLTLKAFGLPHGKAMTRHPEFVRLKIKKMPAAIIQRRMPDGSLVRVDRIEGTLWDRPEKVLESKLRRALGPR